MGTDRYDLAASAAGSAARSGTVFQGGGTADIPLGGPIGLGPINYARAASEAAGAEKAS